MKLAFSTLGCPDWDLSEVIAGARKYTYDGIEWRALGGSLDLPGRDEFASDRIATTREYLKREGIEICCVDTSCTFHSVDASERAAHVNAALVHAELAAKLGAPLIRVFPDTIQPGAERTETRDWIASCLHEIAEQMPVDVDVALETHGDFARAEASVEIVELACHPKVKLIWDIANSVAAGDTIEQAATIFHPPLAPIHLRDAKPVTGSRHWLPVLAGSGRVSFPDALAAIKGLNYDGYMSFEWEKYWHPEIEEPDVAFPDFIKAIGRDESAECSRVGK